jgi:hypothetical protein
VAIPEFDIFRFEKDGSLHWCEAVATFDVAELKVKALIQSANGNGVASYLILDQRTGHRVVFDPEIDGPLESFLELIGLIY